MDNAIALNGVTPLFPSSFGSNPLTNGLLPTPQNSGINLNNRLDVGSSSISKAVSRRGIRLSTRGSRQRMMGTAGDDILDAVRGGGNNFLKGNAGNDRLSVGQRDRAFGDAGNDLLDARRGRGSNILFAGAGNDTVYAKTRDTADGGVGDDILWAGVGGSNLRGGAGRDRFWIADRTLPTGVNTIKDFQLGTDTIGVSAIPGVTQFSDLTLTQQGTDTLISAQGKAIALLSGITASSLTVQNFVGLQPSQIQPSNLILTTSTSNISVSERDTGTTTAVVEVTLGAASTTPVTVNYQTVAGTATANEDFTPVNATLTFAPGETTKAIAIDIINDTRDEFDETFNVVLSNPTNATLANTQAQITILDNDITTITANGIQGDGGKFDAAIGYRFNLYDITATGNYRADEDGNLNNNVGIFSNAVEDFRATLQFYGGNPFLKFERLQIAGERNSYYDVFIPEQLTLNLEARFFPRGSTITLLDGTSEVAAIDRIEYRLTNDRLRDVAGLTEWTLILDEELIGESIIDPVKAVNSIEYIVANSLLGRADQVRFSGISELNPQQIVSEQNSLDYHQATASSSNPASSPRVVTQSTPVAIPRPTPYYSTIAPINDTLAHASDTELSRNGFRQFNLSTQIGGNPTPSGSPPSQDVDLYKVQMNAGEVITIDIDWASSLDSILRVFNASGTQLAFSDNNAAPGESLQDDAYIQFQAITTGTYYIGVSGASNVAYNPLIANSGTLGDSGSYTLTIEICEPNNTIATAFDTSVSIYSSYTTTAQIGDNLGASPGLDVDFYKVYLNSGDLLEVSTDTDNLAAGIDKVDTYLRLFNASGVQLTQNDDNFSSGSGSSTDSFMGFRASTEGTYYIGVSGYNNATYDPLTGTGGASGDTGFYSVTVWRSR
ncbi:DVUA0089 family protein [Oscillatoria sp. FACHB-1407]|uniref:DVUA0089 family protein n=1 Tax=Oscillatoria sp. FACHB-1407 TaxID=2692847 RepID=UPI00168267DD|nr:DVUA0089 family protein [Oscillatoria sp. FACHB-1407]MBD2459639.1 DVUA0089 family protein [Oscillatoria sp. FACHB-1407]